MAKLDVLNPSIRARLLDELTMVSRKILSERNSLSAELGAGDDVSALSVKNAIPIARVSDLDSFMLEDTGSALIPVEKEDAILGFMTANLEPTLGGSNKPSTFLEPNSDQIQNFKIAQTYVEENFDDTYRIVLFEHRPLQIKALVVESKDSRKFIVYQASRNISKNLRFPIEMDEQDMFYLLKKSHPVDGISD